MADSTAALARAIGWLLLIGGVLALGGFAIYALVVDREAPLYIAVRFTTSVITSGAAALLAIGTAVKLG